MMEPSKYDPGDDPDVCLKHSRLLPCLECRIQLHDDTYADWAHDERSKRKEQ